MLINNNAYQLKQKKARKMRDENNRKVTAEYRLKKPEPEMIDNSPLPSSARKVYLPESLKVNFKLLEFINENKQKEIDRPQTADYLDVDSNNHSIESEK